MTKINNVQMARKLKCIPKKYRSEFFNKPRGYPYPVFRNLPVSPLCCTAVAIYGTVESPTH